MNIPELIKEHHQAMIDKGFYDCPECNGSGEGISSSISAFDVYIPDCLMCNGSKIDPNKNIGELLMLIVSELGEALEAHRNNRFAKKEDIEALNYNIGVFDSGIWISTFESQIKDTFEDEISDVFLRLFDLCGYIVAPENFDVVINNINNSMSDISDPYNYGEWMFRFIKYYLADIMNGSDKNYIPAGAIGRSIASLFRFCKRENIPIEKHILAKMEYNKTRPHKHGKEY